MDRAARLELAKLRLQRILSSHGIATARTLENKISDGGPYNQRIDPHILTTARNELVTAGTIVRTVQANVPWYSLRSANPAFVQERFGTQLPIHQRLTQHAFTTRLGQTLEIAASRALSAIEKGEYYGIFADLTQHDDSAPYSKIEPPSQIGNRVLPGARKLDFIFRHDSAGYLGIECKNVREWIYPNREELKDLIQKCLYLDCVPVLIARRIPFVTFKVFSPCGVIFHENYNQFFPYADTELAELARAKDNLGYHDLRIGNDPDARLRKFVIENLSLVAQEARERFEKFRDLLEMLVFGAMPYTQFAARVRRRTLGQNEENDWDEGQPDWELGE